MAFGNHPVVLGSGIPIPAGATGLVGGPASSTDNAIARWDGTSGQIIQNSAVTISDTGDLAPAADNAQALGASSATWSTVHFTNLRGSGGAFTVDNVGIPLAMAGVAIPAGGTAGRGYKFSSTSNFGIFFGSGAPTLAAAKGSLYLRSDGSSTSTRLYVNTDGSTAWTNVTTAA